MTKQIFMTLALALAIAVMAAPVSAQVADTAASAAPRADDECTGKVNYNLKIAVASNLWTPMTNPDDDNLVDAFNQTEEGEDIVVEVCHNSTAVLVSEITTGGNQSGFGLFLAANTAGAEAVCDYGTLCLGSTTPPSPFAYIQGVPVLWTLNQTPGLIDTTDGSIDIVKAAEVVIAKIPDAPYGVAAQEIMENDTKQWDAINEEGKLVQKDNIEKTYDYVFESSPADPIVGYVAKSQVCRGGEIQPPAIYYDNYSKYTPIIQSGAIINLNGTSNTNAQTFVNFLLSNAANAGQDILINTYCYKETDE
jgi:ABC-type molybdate transport system substrate-binding protein